jgi:predicted dehydrogenase
MEKIRTAVIGGGKVGHTHAQQLQTLPESDFVAVCGRDPRRVGLFAERYGVQAFTDVREMIAHARVQAVVVCTPHPTHAVVAVPALEMGVHVLIEKPFAASLHDCDAMLAAATTSGAKLGVISQRRWYQPVQRVKAAIDDGRIGRPALGTVVILGWRDEKYYASDPWRGKWELEGGGVLVNQAPHQLDLLQWFMGPIEELTGYWANLNHPYIEVEDTAVAILRFRGGGLGSIVVSNSQKPGIYGKVHVHGTSGASVGVQTDGGAMFIAGMTAVLEPPVNDLWTVPGEENMLAQWQAEDRATFEKIDAATYYHRLQDQDFLQAIIEDRQPAIPGAEGRKAVELFTAIYRSQRDRAPIRFPLDGEAGGHDLDGRRPGVGAGSRVSIVSGG